MKLSGLIKNSLGMVLIGGGAAFAQSGWTVLNPSSDSRVIYVSNSQGNDNNSGLTPNAPKKTFGAAYALVRNGYPDHMLLKKGDTWTEKIPWAKSGRSASEMMVLGSYGTGPRPMLLTGVQPAIDSGSGIPISHWAIVGIAMSSPSTASEGMRLIMPGDNLLIENCYVEGYANNIVIQGHPGIRTNTRIRRNVLVDPRRTDPNYGGVNVFTAQYDGLLIEENVFDNSIANETNNNGMLSHSIYIGEGSPSNNIIRNNIAHNGGRTNYNVRSGGLIENNLSIRGAQGITCGIGYAPTYVTATVRHNVIIENRNNQNGQPLGFGMSFTKMQSLDVDSNLICNGSGGHDTRGIVMTPDIRAGQIRNNTIYNWQPTNSPYNWPIETIRLIGTPEGPISITNNTIQQHSNSFMVSFENAPAPGTVAVTGNRYHSARTDGKWFVKSAGQTLNYPEWHAFISDNSQLVQLSYPAPNRSIGGYHASIGGAANTTAFMTEARKQSKDFWRPQYTAAAVNNYLRAGFGLPQLGTCRPDMNQDGLLNLADFSEFLHAFGTNSMAADFNNDGILNITDYMAFLQAFGLGCP
jgi:hypothetical protein